MSNQTWCNAVRGRAVGTIRNSSPKFKELVRRKFCWSPNNDLSLEMHIRPGKAVSPKMYNLKFPRTGRCSGLDVLHTARRVVANATYHHVSDETEMISAGPEHRGRPSEMAKRRGQPSIVECHKLLLQENLSRPGRARIQRRWRELKGQPQQ